MGNSDITQVANEILGLSKMNWNTFDYYSQLPATLASADAIAKIGPYLSGFGSVSYDYRLLI
jgi:argonaute-like protein implicated in RNA metabolism and viral defense